ncbi:MAG TPA: hypothetical protein ENJ01_00135 [Gammaproteobacteria bacterium]|nr:hypothetical protein [Gammaproteobacteria bacterium]
MPPKGAGGQRETRSPVFERQRVQASAREPGALRVSRSDGIFGSPFLWELSFGEAKESSSLAAASEKEP